ncbi:uncharacterized protein [Heliangelus exortis]|uniref:uncharacterized protein n=1 Tax=Heliangelus exortis TaxID=472823 RepID=UPI003A904C75
MTASTEQRRSPKRLLLSRVQTSPQQASDSAASLPQGSWHSRLPYVSGADADSDTPRHAHLVRRRWSTAAPGASGTGLLPSTCAAAPQPPQPAGEEQEVAASQLRPPNSSPRLLTPRHVPGRAARSAERGTDTRVPAWQRTTGPEEPNLRPPTEALSTGSCPHRGTGANHQNSTSLLLLPPTSARAHAKHARLTVESRRAAEPLPATPPRSCCQHPGDSYRLRIVNPFGRINQYSDKIAQQKLQKWLCPTSIPASIALHCSVAKKCKAARNLIQ